MKLGFIANTKLIFMGEYEFETPNAKYKVDFEMHIGKSRFPKSVDAIIDEGIFDETFDIKHFESELNNMNELYAKNRLKDYEEIKKRNLDYWVVDVIEKYPTFLQEFMHPIKPFLEPIFFPFKLLSGLSSVALGFRGKILKRKPLMKIVSTETRWIPRIGATGRSAIWAHKTENYISKYYQNKLGRKPTLGAVMGAVHADFVDYAQNPRLIEKYFRKYQNRLSRNYTQMEDAYRIFFNNGTNKWVVEKHTVPIFPK